MVWAGPILFVGNNKDYSRFYVTKTDKEREELLTVSRKGACREG